MRTRTLFALLFLAIASLAEAATYYVQPSGSDTGCTGLSSASYDGSGTGEACAWQTLSKVNSSVSATSSDVYLLQGNTYNLPSTGLVIDWEGASGDRVIIGSYYLDESSNPVVGYTTTRAKVSGVGRTLPSSIDGYGVRITTEYVTVQDLEVAESNGTGVRVDATGNYATINNLKVHHCYTNGITNYTADNVNITNNEVYENVYWDYTDTPANWGQGIGVRTAASTTLTGNRIYRNWGEGIAAYGQNTSLVIDKNVVYDNRRPNIYDDCNSGVVISRNLVYNSSNAINTIPAHFNIWLTAEETQSYCGSSWNDHKVWGNLTSGGRGNIVAWYPSVASPTGVEIYNNTAIEPISDAANYNVRVSNVTGALFKNNIVWQSSGNAATIAIADTGDVTGDYNAWSKASSSVDADIRGANDLYSFSTLSKTTGWTYTEIAPNSLTGAEYGVAAGSPAINGGVDVCPSGCAAGYEYDTLLDMRTTDLTVPTWTTYQDTGTPDIGAVPYLEQEAPPSGGGGLPGGTQAAWKLAADLNDLIGSNNLSATGTVSQAVGHGGGSNTARSVATESASNYLSVADNAALNPTGSMSVSFWFKKTGAVTNDSLNWVIGKGSTNRPWGFRYYTYGSNDTLQFGVKNTTGTPSNYATYTFSGAMPTDTWQHIVAVFDSSSSTASVYVNKVKGTDYTYAYSTLYDDNEALYVLSNGGALKAIPGVIDDIALYHRVLTTTEINDLYNLVDDFATTLSATLKLNSFGSTAVNINAGEAVTFTWDYDGSPSVCKLYPYNNATEVTVTCSDKSYSYTYNGDPGLYSAKICLDPAGSNVCSTLTNIVRIKDLDRSTYPTTFTICASGCDSTGAIADNTEATGLLPGYTVKMLGNVAVDLSGYTGGGSLKLDNTQYEPQNITGPGASSLTLEPINRASVLNYTGVNRTLTNVTVKGWKVTTTTP